MKIIVYDGTFQGYLTVIFTQYKEIFKIKIESEKDQISFLDQKYVKTNFENAKRVEDSIKKNISREFFYDIKMGFKSDYKNKDTIIARLIKLAFIKGEKITKSTNKYAIAFNKIVKNYGLWIGFYDAIAIKERKNKKLMIENMPKKYWKYLPEKNRKN